MIVSRHPAEISIDRLTSTDWQLIRDVRLRALSDAPYAFGSTYEEESNRGDEWWKSHTEHVDGHPGAKLAWYVALLGERPIGLVGGFPSTSKGEGSPELISMWVHPDWRGSGVAGELLAAVVEWAENEAASELILDVADGNDRARGFYERAGFVATGRAEPLRSDPSRLQHRLRLKLRGSS